MPYMKVEQTDGTWAVFKRGEDKKPTGKMLGVHEDEDDADEQIAALYAAEDEEDVTEMVNVHSVIVSEFSGPIPKVPAAPGVDVAQLLKDDKDPFFVTLPVARAGAVSKNGLQHDDDLVNSVIEQINSRGVFGITGHIKEGERDTAYPIPTVYWIGAMRVGKDAVAKGYIPPIAGAEMREHFRVLKATGGEAATSLYGTAVREMEGARKKWHAKDLNLEQIDLAPYKRAALPMGDWSITAEMEQETTEQEADKMADKPTRIEEISQELRNEVIAEFKKEQEYEQAIQAVGRVAELETTNGELVTRVAELETTAKELTEQNEQMKAQVAEHQRAAFGVTIDRLISEQVKLESLRPVVKRLLVAELAEDTEEAAIASLKELLENEDFRALAQAAIVVEMGPGLSAFTGNGKDSPTPEDMAAARAQRGF